MCWTVVFPKSKVNCEKPCEVPLACMEVHSTREPHTYIVHSVQPPLPCNQSCVGVFNDLCALCTGAKQEHALLICATSLFCCAHKDSCVCSCIMCVSASSMCLALSASAVLCRRASLGAHGRVPTNKCAHFLLHVSTFSHIFFCVVPGSRVCPSSRQFLNTLLHQPSSECRRTA